jgi:HSP20 family protein
MTERGESDRSRMRRELDTLFGRLFGSWLSPFEREELEPLRMWEFGVTENDKEFVIRAEMPGFEPNEIDVQLDNDILTIRAAKEEKGDGTEQYRSFSRTMALPAGVDAEQVQASYRNGVLELHIPRPEGTQPKRIKIEGQTASKQERVPGAEQTTTARSSNVPSQQGSKTETTGKAAAHQTKT